MFCVWSRVSKKKRVHLEARMSWGCRPPVGRPPHRRRREVRAALKLKFRGIEDGRPWAAHLKAVLRRSSSGETKLAVELNPEVQSVEAAAG